MDKKILLSLAAASLLAACGDDDEPQQQQSALTCDAYCNQINAACTGADDQYTFQAGTADCLAYCNGVGWAQGAVGQVGNTLGCRVDHADNTPPATHCGHAGPSGGNLCGTWCDTYCELATEVCGTQLFASAAACTAACPGIPATGAVNAQSGNSIQCRIWHLGQALLNTGATRTTHCGHAAATPTAPCS